MTTTARTQFDTIVAEVERDTAEIIHYDTTDLDGKAGMATVDAIPTEISLSAFSDFKVRDALLVKANENEEFAFVLINKVMGKAKQEFDTTETVNQDLVEAVSTVAHISAMWEQEGNARHSIGLCEQLCEEHGLEVPSLIDASKKVLMAGALGLKDITQLREDMVKDLKDILFAELDKE